MAVMKNRASKCDGELSASFFTPPDECCKVARNAGLLIDEATWLKLGRYLELLLKMNQSMNLTAVRDPASAWPRHILESVLLMSYLPRAGMIIDLGSGGGLPGIPLAIVRPDVRILLVESSHKKADFLMDCRDALRLKNVSVEARRAEVLGHEESFRGQYDLVLSRAVGALPEIIELSAPLCSVGGTIIALKGENYRDELAGASEAMDVMRCSLDRVDMLSVPGRRISAVICIKKNAITPSKYPRKPGMPKKRPLLSR